MTGVMDKTFLSRRHLESLSTADLISLADDYGIDIPDNLNRRFIIGELLEAAEELEGEAREDVHISEDMEVSERLPQGYNETKIHVMLRNPAWAFVFWDMQEDVFSALLADEDFGGFFLQPAFFDSRDAEAPLDFFDIQVSPADRQQYVLIPPGRKIMAVYLKCNRGGKGIQTLAYSERIALHGDSPLLAGLQPGKKLDLPPLVQLSGMEALLREQYRQHRQTF